MIWKAESIEKTSAQVWSWALVGINGTGGLLTYEAVWMDTWMDMRQNVGEVQHACGTGMTSAPFKHNLAIVWTPMSIWMA